MTKKKMTLPDGRYIIYYTFDSTAAAATSAASCPNSACNCSEESAVPKSDREEDAK